MRRALLAPALAAVVLVALAPRAADGEWDGPLDERVEALRAADRFLDRYLGPDGRVVRHDEGGDTVSEGQAYAMLTAVALGDVERFEAAWRWAEANLLQPGRGLAWRWADGAVIDPHAAADADLDAAHALALAARRFARAEYAADAERLGRAVLDNTIATRAGEVPAAGPWAVGEGIVNPSYLSPVAFDVLGSTTGERRWRGIAASSRVAIGDLLALGRLVPDWAALDAAGGATPVASPGSGEPGEPLAGFDAARVPLRHAASCDAADREVARRLAPPLLEVRDDGGHPPALLALDGRPRSAQRHPAATVAAAAAAAATGDDATSAHLLDAAEALDARRPTYFGAAIVALGRLLLDTELLGGCPP